MFEFTTYGYIVLALSLIVIIYGILDRIFGDEYDKEQKQS